MSWRAQLKLLSGGNIFAHVLQAAKPAARASLVSTCRPRMKQDWRWTCSFPSIGNARSSTYRKESSVISIESESIFNSDLNDVETSRWPRLPSPLKAKFAKKTHHQNSLNWSCSPEARACLGVVAHGGAESGDEPTCPPPRWGNHPSPWEYYRNGQ